MTCIRCLVLLIFLFFWLSKNKEIHVNHVKSNEHSKFLKLQSCIRFDYFSSFCPSIVRLYDGIKLDVPDFRRRYEPTFFSTSFWLFSSSYQKEKCQKNYCFETRRHHCPSPSKRRNRLELDFYFLQCAYLIFFMHA